jgi:hypothetical protein
MQRLKSINNFIESQNISTSYGDSAPNGNVPSEMLSTLDVEPPLQTPKTLCGGVTVFGLLALALLLVLLQVACALTTAPDSLPTVGANSSTINAPDSPTITMSDSPTIDSPGSPQIAEHDTLTTATPGSPADAGLADENGAWRIRIVDTTGDEIWSFTENTLATQLSWKQAVYSTINNWPATRFYVAGGYSITDILQAAGGLDIAQTVTFRAADGYEVSLTRDQLLNPQYYFPWAGENSNGAISVEPVVAYRWKEGSDDLKDLRDDKPSLIFGQRSIFEHTNPAFVIGLSEIVVDDNPCDTWPPATTFPLPGLIAYGEAVKLQHPDYGLVKLHYTLDGSEPTALSPMYNPSTYQPELNRPIPITEITVIKVIACGYGKNDSEIATYEFMPIS